MQYIAVIETPEGLVYEQPYNEFEELVDLIYFLGCDYRIVSIY